MKRLFWGIDLSGDEIFSKFQFEKEGLLNNMKWVPPENYHATLCFLGNVEEERLGEMKRMGAEAAGLCSPFKIQISGVGAFPSLKNPRTLWYGIDLNPGLGCIHSKLKERFAPYLCLSDKKFIPHMTFAKVKGRDYNLTGLPKINIEKLIREFCLFESVVKNGRVQYQKIEKFELNEI